MGRKRIAVLGATGSIGRQTLDVVRALPEQFRIVALTAGNNLELLAAQSREFHPDYIHHTFRKEKAEDILGDDCGRFLPLTEIVSHPDIDYVVMAVAGSAALAPTLAAVTAGKKIALANKEALVTAGEIITTAAQKSGAQILPVDSEHSAIWQCLLGEGKGVSRIILTASGGPFRDWTAEQLRTVTREQALQHPSWRMGQKVTIDSATLMNKGLEIMEAHWLFRVPLGQISVLIHPQSIVHSMVEFADGAVKAQLSFPNMRLPIQYALTYPERVANADLPRLDWSTVPRLDFAAPDMGRFPCLKLAIEAGEKGGTYPAVLCAADEVAVAFFLAERIGFLDIPSLVADVLAQHKAVANPTIDEISEADTWARQKTLELVARKA